MPEENYPSNDNIKKLFDYAVAKKPPGWAVNSCAPYFKEFYARNIKEAIDKQLENREDIVYRYDIFCGRNQEITSHTTLYNRINQSIRYLLMHLDTEDKKYLTWKQIVNIKRVEGLGIRISFIPEFRNPSQDFKPEFVLPKEDLPQWRRRMDDWLEGDSQEPFVLERMSLTHDEVITLNRELGSLQGIIAQVNSGSIKIIRHIK